MSDPVRRLERPLFGGDGTVRRLGLVATALAFFGVVIVLPLGNIFVQAFKEGGARYLEVIGTPEALHALTLTGLVTGCSVLVTAVFGIAAAAVLARDRFPGIAGVSLLVDLPFTVSPVIVGLLVVLVYSPTVGLLSAWTGDGGVKILFAWPSLVIATVLVATPLVARELLPAWQNLERTGEEAAETLGASGWQVFRYVVFPALRWPLIYGIALTSARSVGEYGAVSVVSGKLINDTNTLTLHIERCYTEYQSLEAFAAASLLAGVSLVVLLLEMIMGLRAKG